MFTLDLVVELDAVEAARKAAKDKKRKQETPVVGDIGLLGEALPTLDMLLKSDQHKKKYSTMILSPGNRIIDKFLNYKHLFMPIFIFNYVICDRECNKEKARSIPKEKRRQKQM